MTTDTGARPFTDPATGEQVDRAAAALREHGFEVIVAADRDAARAAVLERIAAGAEVHTSTSVTLDELGITDEVASSGRYDAVRPRLYAMDRTTQGREISKLASAPDVQIGSVHAVTEDGDLLIASATGSQLAGYAFGAGKVLFVVGTQKIVPDLSTGLRRLHEHSLPLEDARAQRTYGRGSSVNKVLVISREVVPDRITVIFVPEALGF